MTHTKESELRYRLRLFRNSWWRNFKGCFDAWYTLMWPHLSWRGYEYNDDPNWIEENQWDYETFWMYTCDFWNPVNPPFDEKDDIMA